MRAATEQANATSRSNIIIIRQPDLMAMWIELISPTSFVYTKIPLDSLAFADKVVAGIVAVSSWFIWAVPMALPAIRVAIDLQVDAKFNGHKVKKGFKQLWHHKEAGVNGINIVMIDVMTVKCFFQSTVFKLL